MRITGGMARGIPLETPRGEATRPATDALRQALFSSIASHIPGASFVDFFAGSGSYGLEALSRGAAGGVFVERNPKAVSCIKKNITSVCKSMGKGCGAMHVFCMDVFQWRPAMAGGGTPDIIFIDPPYELLPEVAEPLFAHIDSIIPAEVSPLVVFEMPAQVTLSSPTWDCVHRLGKRSAHQPNIGIFQRKRV